MAAGCHENGQAEGGAPLVSGPRNRIDISPEARLFPQPAREEEDGNAHPHSAAPIVQLTATK